MTTKEYIIRYILLKIFSKSIKISEQLPSENKLCEIFSCSRETVRKVYEKLEALDIIFSKKGSGHLVSENYLDNYFHVPKNLIFDEYELIDNSKEETNYKLKLNSSEYSFLKIRTKINFKQEKNTTLDDLFAQLVLQSNLSWDSREEYKVIKNNFIIYNIKFINTEEKKKDLEIEFNIPTKSFKDSKLRAFI